MALALLLRNTTKLPGIFISQSLKNPSTSITARSFCLTAHQNQALSARSHKLLLTAPIRKSILTCQQNRLMSADHSKLWPIEKAISVGLLVLVPATFAFPNILFDNLLAATSVIHFHWGLEAVIVDYARPIVVGNLLPKVAIGLLYLISALTLGGLIYFNVNDIGIGKGARKFWAIKTE